MKDNYLSYKDIIKLEKEKTDSRVACKNCGHTMNIVNKTKKCICSHCGYYVFTNDKEEFKFRLQNSYKGVKRKEV